MSNLTKFAALNSVVFDASLFKRLKLSKGSKRTTAMAVVQKCSKWRPFQNGCLHSERFRSSALRKCSPRFPRKDPDRLTLPMYPVLLPLRFSRRCSKGFGSGYLGIGTGTGAGARGRRASLVFQRTGGTVKECSKSPLLRVMGEIVTMLEGRERGEGSRRTTVRLQQG